MIQNTCLNINKNSPTILKSCYATLVIIRCCQKKKRHILSLNNSFALVPEINLSCHDNQTKHLLILDTQTKQNKSIL